MSEKPQNVLGSSHEPTMTDSMGEVSGKELNGEYSTEHSELDQTLRPDVSRETSEAPSETNLLDEIMDRAMPKISYPSEESAVQDFSPPKEPQTEKPENPSTPPGNKRSSVYVYLVVLFGAAFLMLLLAYFVQQRSNQTAISDLQNSMNLSREELMEKIKTLEQKNEELQKDVDLYQYSTDLARKQYEEATKTARETDDLLSQVHSQLVNTMTLGYLERFINEGDYLMAACIVEQSDQYFNQRNRMHGTTNALPTQVTRYMKLRDWLYDNTYIAIYEYPSDDGGITERPVMALSVTNVSDESRPICTVARDLWDIIRLYANPFSSNNFTSTAQMIKDFCDPDSPEGGGLELLHSGAFKPSTVELFEEIKADLLSQGWLAETENGLTVTENDSMLFKYEETDPH